MCGIFLYLGSESIRGKQKLCLCKLSDKLIHRGPDQKQVSYYSDNVMMGFHRLAIVDPTPTGIQPFESSDGRFVCMCNGEIYNFRELKQYLKDENIDWKTHSDCEVIVHLFNYYTKSNEDMEKSLQKLCGVLDGEYAIVIYDHETKNVYYATDELSMRPLFIGRSHDPKLYGYFIASEQKAMIKYCSSVTRVKAGSCGSVRIKSGNTERCHFKMNKIGFYSPLKTTFDQAVLTLRQLLIKNVITKLSPDREFVFLLSGGIDSSLICSIAAKELYPARIRTFTVGFSDDATDVIAAKKVAHHIDSIHTTFICTYQEGIDMIPSAVYHNESWDQTTTRAAIPMLLCAKKIREKHPDVAVIFSGEVADEMLRGYLYNRKTPSLKEGKKDQIMRLQNLHTSDGIRADRVCAAYSFECRFPFFSKELIEFSLRVPEKYLNPSDNDMIEKFILRKAFDKETGDKFEYLPDEILWRTKTVSYTHLTLPTILLV